MYRSSHTALQEYRQAGTCCRLKKRVVLHVACADLQNVGILGDHGNVVLRHDLGHDSQTTLFARTGQHLETLKAMSLKCIGRTARLEGATAQNAGAGATDMVGGGHQLEFSFN